LEINTNINDSIGIGIVLNQIGFVYSNLGDYNTAVDKISEAAIIMKDMNDMWELAGVYNNMGIVLQHAGRTEKALEYYKNAVTIYEEQGELGQILPIMSNIGTLFFRYERLYQSRGISFQSDRNKSRNKRYGSGSTLSVESGKCADASWKTG